MSEGRVIHADCRDALRDMPDASIDSIVTDPPYELGFMGKQWDASGIAYDVNLWRECLRVLKPGGHLLAFGGTRTYHRMAVAIEDAGFEVRDSIHWLYGSGFPKSLDVSKAIDKAAGAEREVLSQQARQGRSAGILGTPVEIVRDITAPATDAAKQWQGWGTALKPAHEPIIVARKPLTGTVAANVLEHGTGAINIDGCRVAGALKGDPNRFAKTDGGSFAAFSTPPVVRAAGRWPANVTLDDWFAEQHPEWSHYFYVAKAGKAERDAGLDGMPKQAVHRLGAGIGEGLDPDAPAFDRNHHPTVKPLALMRWLVRLVTPPNGTVLDPFLGSGTTAVAAVLEGFDWVGCEMTADYLPVIQGRVAWATEQAAQPQQLELTA